jgi:hypothetical protein
MNGTIVFVVTVIVIFTALVILHYLWKRSKKK